MLTVPALLCTINLDWVTIWLCMMDKTIVSQLDSCRRRRRLQGERGCLRLH